AGVGPTLFPVVEMGLGLFQRFETEAFQRRVLGMTDTSLDLTLSIGIIDTARQRNGTVMSEYVAIEWIDSGIVDVGRDHAFTEVVQHNGSDAATQSAEGFLMEFRPGLRTGSKHQQTHAFAAVAESEDEQSGASILAVFRIADHRTGAVIDLAFFTWRSFDADPSFRSLLAADLVDESSDALIAGGELIGIDQVLPDGLGIATSG